MVAYKADGHDNGIARALGGKLREHLADIRFQPRHLGRAAAALIGDRPVFVSEAFGNQARAGFDLPDVFPSARHGSRDAMSGKDQRRRLVTVRGNGRERLLCQVGHRLDE